MRLYTYLALLLVSSNTYAESCPGNFAPISPHDSIEHVITQCGSPTERVEYKQTYTETANNYANQGAGYYNQGRNVHLQAGAGNAAGMTVTRERTIKVTRLQYGNVFLYFVDGKWVGYNPP